MAHVSHVSDYAHPMGTQHSCALHLSLVTPPTPPTSGISGPTPKTTPLQKKPGNPCKTWKAVGTRTRISIRSDSPSRGLRGAAGVPRLGAGGGPGHGAGAGRRGPGERAGDAAGVEADVSCREFYGGYGSPNMVGSSFGFPQPRRVFLGSVKRDTHTQMQGCLFGPGREMESTNWGSRIRKV